VKLTEELHDLNKKVDSLIGRVANLEGSNRLAGKLIKYVILPLILTLGGLVGIKLW